MTDRRSFVASLGSATLVGPWRARAPQVEATASVFYGHPDAETTLVRFVVHDAETPAGRMRVFAESGRRLIGTAGVLGVGDRLIGELWLPADDIGRIVSELEMPGLDRPLRTEHRLRPMRRWTIHWATIVDPRTVERLLAPLPPWRRAVAVALLHRAGVTTNPLAGPDRPVPLLDHVDFLQTPQAARRVRSIYGIATSLVAVARGSTLDNGAVATMLDHIGVPYAFRADAVGTQTERLRGVDGATVDIVSAPGHDPQLLGFNATADVFAGRIEGWLARIDPQYPPQTGDPRTFVLGTAADDTLPRMIRRVSDWNDRFAYPRIVTGDAEVAFDTLRFGIGPPPVRRPPHTAPPSTSALASAARGRARDRDARLADQVDAVRSVAGVAASGLHGLAEALALPGPGSLVWNPSPVARSDLVTMPDGSERVVTDVPALGFAYLPASIGPGARPRLEPGDVAVSGRILTIRIDPGSGAVRSLYDRNAGREWVQPRSPGINWVPRASLRSVTRYHLANVGMRLIIDRVRDGLALRTTITAYDGYPWIDIANVAEGNATVPYHFPFQAEDPRVSWETPAGFEVAVPPIAPTSHLRWFATEGGDGWRILLHAIDAPYIAADFDGRAVSLSAPGHSRYRLALASPFAPPDERWHSGWSAEPLAIAPTSGTGTIPFPRFGHLVAVSDPGVYVIGLRAARDGDGVVLVLQDVVGASRDVVLSSGVLGFQSARAVDTLERDIARLPMSTDRVSVFVPAYGIAAIRLQDLALRGG